MRKILAGLSVMLFVPGIGAGAEPPSKHPEPPKTFDLQAIDAYVAAVVRDRGIPGIGLAIVRDGKIVLAKGYGKRSIESGAEVEAETAFAAGSVTKQFACAAILMLAEDGKLSADDRVSKYFPSLTRGGEITLQQLMSHTSGYPDYYPLDFVDRRLEKPIAVDALIAEYAGGKLDFEPGSRWSYSNTGYMILGRVVEKVSGESFGSFVRRRILEPSGMKSSSLDPAPDDSGRARGYLSLALGPKEPAKPESDGWLFAAGGLWASAPDLARWDLALMEGRLLSPESFRRMSTPVILSDGRSRDYGCGLSIVRREGEIILSHGGAISGFRAYNAMIPRTRSALAVLVNDEQSAPEMTGVLLGLLIKGEPRQDIPSIAGLPADKAALDFFHQLQAGSLDRDKLGDEFSAYMTPDRVRDAAPRFKTLGEPEGVDVESVNERGGMAVASIRLRFKGTNLTGLLYRSPDGKIQQLLFNKD